MSLCFEHMTSTCGCYREVYTKDGEVHNLRQRLAAYEKDLADLRAQNHSLLNQVSSGRGSTSAGGAAASREVARIRELEKEITKVRSSFDFRENEHQKIIRFKSALPPQPRRQFTCLLAPVLFIPTRTACPSTTHSQNEQ